MPLPINTTGPKERTRVLPRRVADPGRFMNPASAGAGFGVLAQKFAEFGNKLGAEEKRKQEELAAIRDQDALSKLYLDVVNDPDRGAEALRTGNYSAFMDENQAGRLNVLKHAPGTIGEALGSSSALEFTRSLKDLPAGTSGIEAREQFFKEQTQGMNPRGALKFRESFFKGTAKGIAARQKANMDVFAEQAMDRGRTILKARLATGDLNAESLVDLKAQIATGIVNVEPAKAAFMADEMADQVLVTGMLSSDPAVATLSAKLASEPNAAGLTLQQRYTDDEYRKMRETAVSGMRGVWTEQADNAMLRMEIALAHFDDNGDQEAWNSAVNEYIKAGVNQSWGNHPKYKAGLLKIAKAKADVDSGSTVYESFKGGGSPDFDFSEKDKANALKHARESGDIETYARMIGAVGSSKGERNMLTTAITAGTAEQARQSINIIKAVQTAKSNSANTRPLNEIIDESAIGFFYRMQNVEEADFAERFEEIKKDTRGVAYTEGAYEKRLNIAEGSTNGPKVLAEFISSNRADIAKAAGLEGDSIFDEQAGLKDFSPEAQRVLRRAVNTAAWGLSNEVDEDDSKLIAAVGEILRGKLMVTPSPSGDNIHVTTYSGPKRVMLNGKVRAVEIPGEDHSNAFKQLLPEGSTWRNLDLKGWADVRGGADSVDIHVQAGPGINGGRIPQEFVQYLPPLWASGEPDDGQVVVRASPPKEGGPTVLPSPGHLSVAWHWNPRHETWRLRHHVGASTSDPKAGAPHEKVLQWLSTSLRGNNESIATEIADAGGQERIFSSLERAVPLMTASEEELDRLSGLEGTVTQIEAMAESARRAQGGFRVTAENIEDFIKALPQGEEGPVPVGVGRSISDQEQFHNEQTRVNAVKKTKGTIEHLVDSGYYPPSVLRAVGDEPDLEKAVAIADKHSASVNHTPGGQDVMVDASSFVRGAHPFQQTYEKPVHRKTMGTSRGARNNNPGNIMDGSFTRSQAGHTKGTDSRFATFETPEDGIRAMHALLRGSGYIGGGRNTIRQIIFKYAPPNDIEGPQDSLGYAKRVATSVGKDINERVTVDDLPEIMGAMMRVEMGNRDGEAFAQRIEHALRGIDDDLPMDGSLTPTIGYGTRLDWPTTENEMAAVGIDPAKPITEEQAEALAETRLAFIKQSMTKWFDAVPFAAHQSKALITAIYSSPWINGKPEVLTDTLVEAAHAEDWGKVAREIRRATRVTTQGLSTKQKHDERERLKTVRQLQAAMFMGLPSN